MRYLRHHAIALIALFVALGGTAYAVAELPAHSVGTRQLRHGAVTNGKVRAHTLSGEALQPRLLSALSREPSYTVRTAELAWNCHFAPGGFSCSGNTAIARCQPGESVTGGGLTMPGPGSHPGETPTLTESRPTEDGWLSSFSGSANANWEPGGEPGPVPPPSSGTVYAVCASG